MEAEHEKLEETMRSEHEISIASYAVEAELQTEVTLCSVSQFFLILISVAFPVSHLLKCLVFSSAVTSGWQS